MIYTVLLIIIAVIAYGCGSMSSVVIASNFVFHVNLRRLGTGSSALSNFRRIYGVKGFVKLLLVELVRDILPILIGGLLMGIKSQAAVGRAFAGFCLVMGRLYPVFYDLKGSHAIICMLVVMAFVNFSGALAVLLFVVLGIWLTKYVSLGAVAGAAVMCIASLLLVDDPLVMKLALFAGLAVLVRHIPAVSRMLSGRETKLSFEEDISYKLDNKF
mgnify:FL=1